MRHFSQEGRRIAGEDQQPRVEPQFLVGPEERLDQPFAEKARPPREEQSLAAEVFPVRPRVGKNVVEDRQERGWVETSSSYASISFRQAVSASGLGLA